MADRNNRSEENQSVVRAIAILNLLSEAQKPMGVREVARHISVAPSIAQRLIRTLANAGYVEQTGEASRYTIGYRAFQIGNAFIARTNLYTAVMPELYALASHDINGFLAVRRHDRAVYLATVQSHGPIAIMRRPGDETSLHSTALGKAILAEMRNDEILKLLPDPLPRLTPQTKTSLTELLDELETVRRLGFAVNEQENRVGVYSAGAIVQDASNRGLAALSGAVPSAGLTSRDRTKIIDLVVQAADVASRKLGAQPRAAHPSRAEISGPSSPPPGGNLQRA